MGLRVIHIPDCSRWPESDSEVAVRLAEHYALPRGPLRFALLARVRAVRGFTTLEGRRVVCRARLQALVLLYGGPDHGEWRWAGGHGSFEGGGEGTQSLLGGGGRRYLEASHPLLGAGV